MARKVGQVRFYANPTGNGTSTSLANKNYPSNINITKLMSGSLFNNLNIVQLGVQALPGTKLYLNRYNSPIIIGATGIYELNLEGLTYINGIQFDKTSLENISNNANAMLIIDYIYEEE